MLELPEALSRAKELNQHAAGKTVACVYPPTSPHRFCWFSGAPERYGDLLCNRTLDRAEGFGIFVDLIFDGGVRLSVNDGVNIRLYGSKEDAPKNYQLLIVLTDGAALAFTVAMYGSILCHNGGCDNPYYLSSRNAVSPLDERFDKARFAALVASVKPATSVKALLTAEQRIPGLGNGALQDILFVAGVHPKRKVSSFTQQELDGLFTSVATVLAAMTDRGGRDTEKDLFGNPGGYRTLLSKNTFPYPCPNCGGGLVKETYLGGTVYFCPVCQPEAGGGASR